MEIALDSRFDTPMPDVFTRPKHNLPAQSTPFVGRESELDEVAKLLDNPKIRLVTILPPGGRLETLGDGIANNCGPPWVVSPYAAS
jgi:hypothetical protein